MIFADTSGIYAALVATDARHAKASAVWQEQLHSKQRFLTTSYVVHEAVALLQARLGISAVQRWRIDVEPVLDIVWVDALLHRTAMAALVVSAKPDVSLTDWVSFEVMRRMDAHTAFAIDRHFSDEGFTVIPTG